MAKVSITDELGAKRLYGVPYTGTWNTQWPITRDIGPVRFVEAKDGIGLPPPPPDVDAYIEENLPPLPRGVAETDPEILRIMRGHPFGTPRTKAEYRRAIELYAMPVGSLDPSPERDAAAACTHAVWPWGEGRDAFRRELEEARRKEEEARAEAEERARIAALPNTKTLRELGYVGVLLPHGTAPTSWPHWLSVSDMFPPSDELRKSCIRHPEGDVLLYRPRFGVEFGEEQIPGTPCRFVSEFVPERKPAMKARPLPFAALEGRGVDDSELTVSRDGRTAEGETAEADFIALVKAHERDTSDMVRQVERHGATELARFAGSAELTHWGRWLVQVGRRGFGLRRELVIYNIKRLFPAGTWSDARLEKFCDQADKGTAAWFSADELYTPPSPNFVQRFLALFGEERRWRAVLEALVEGREYVIKADCQQAIIDAGLAAAFTNEEHERVIRVMTALGFRDGRKSIDGEVKRCFVREMAK